MRGTAKSHSRRSSCVDDFSWLKRSDGGDIGDEVGNPEDQFSRIGVLKDLAAYAQFNVERMWIWDLILSYDCWAKWREGVEAFPQRPLRSGHLDVACTDVIHDGVAEDMFLPSIGWNVLSAFADDECQFGFIVGLLGEFWHTTAEVILLPPILNPPRIFCLGLAYRDMRAVQC
jgi:hypothetical protein